MQISRKLILTGIISFILTASVMAQTDSGIPHLQKQGSATQLVVDGKPFLIVSGELSNNAATSLENPWSPSGPSWSPPI